jgi:hypothetical protein
MAWQCSLPINSQPVKCRRLYRQTGSVLGESIFFAYFMYCNRGFELSNPVFAASNAGAIFLGLTLATLYKRVSGGVGKTLIFNYEFISMD